MVARHGTATLALAVGALGCGSPSARERFDSDVAPLLEKTCLAAACHGVLPDAEARGETVDFSRFYVRVTARGRIADPEAAYLAAKRRINTLELPEHSTLLEKPLARSAGGTPHLGGVQLASRQAPGYRAIRRWIAEESGGGEGERVEELPDTMRLFATTVLPELALRQCTNESCHGAFAPFTSFEPPVALNGELDFDAHAIRKNHAAARMHLFLGGDPLRSRLVRKLLPLAHGGIVHRGGNDLFFTGTSGAPRSDPLLDAIVSWADAERAAEAPTVSGIVFVRGPLAAEKLFRHDTFTPGSDLFVLEPPEHGGALRNLTAAAHPGGPADVRDPAVSHDGRRIAFAMRKSEDDALNLYEIGVDGSGLRPLTSDSAALAGGGVRIHAQPTYGPDGRIFFVSTRSGHVSRGSDELDTEVWAIEPETRELERLSFDPSPQASPSFIGTGKSHGTLAFTVRRAIGGRWEAPVFRMPLDHNADHHADPELHIHHGVTRAPEAVYAMRALPDGRFACVLAQPDDPWRSGKLAIFDRQLGPDSPPGTLDDMAVNGFRHAFEVLDSDGGYRHPAPLPDGRSLVAYASEPPDFGIWRIDADGANRTLIVDEPGVADYDAEPIVARPLEDDPSHADGWDASRASSTGRLSFRHVETLEAIFQNLEQRGAKPLRTDLAYARLVESVPATPVELAKPVGLSSHGRVRILAEVALRGGSIELDVPAERAFRVQFLDENRMAVGAQHNRWLWVAPGERFPGGVDPALYPTLCAGCHGALSGDPGDVGGPIPDLVTAASVTLATHENLDPRRPIAPVVVGDAPFAVDFVHHVRPLIERSCTSGGCHGESAALDLRAAATQSFDTAYEALLASGDYVDAEGSSAWSSHLIERLYGRELGAPRELSGSCAGEPPLDEEERLVFVRWIDLGAPYRGGEP